MLVENNFFKKKLCQFFTKVIKSEENQFTPFQYTKQPLLFYRTLLHFYYLCESPISANTNAELGKNTEIRLEKKKPKRRALQKYSSTIEYYYYSAAHREYLGLSRALKIPKHVN